MSASIARLAVPVSLIALAVGMFSCRSGEKDPPAPAAAPAIPAPAASAADEAPPAPREFRAGWVATVGNIDWPSKPGLPAAQQQKEII